MLYGVEDQDLLLAKPPPQPVNIHVSQKQVILAGVIVSHTYPMPLYIPIQQNVTVRTSGLNIRLGIGQAVSASASFIRGKLVFETGPTERITLTTAVARQYTANVTVRIGQSITVLQNKMKVFAVSVGQNVSYIRQIGKTILVKIGELLNKGGSPSAAPGNLRATQSTMSVLEKDPGSITTTTGVRATQNTIEVLETDPGSSTSNTKTRTTQVTITVLHN